MFFSKNLVLVKKMKLMSENVAENNVGSVSSQTIKEPPKLFLLWPDNPS